MATDRSIRLAFVLAVLVLVVDVATEAAIVGWVEYGARHAWLPMVSIVHVLNPGAAFDFLHDAGGWQHYLFIAFALAVSVFLLFMIRRPSISRPERIAFGLVLGGALANMIDRLLYGAVVDWIDVHWGAHGASFNIADVAVSVGIALFVLHEFRGRQGRTRTPGPTA